MADVVVAGAAGRMGSRLVALLLQAYLPLRVPFFDLFDLPLIVTIGDNDLRGLVKQAPGAVSDVYRQSVAEELLQQREEALARITQLGGLALDVPAGRLSFELVNKYLEVKERGLL